jgi:hypothetical protein
VLLGPAPVGCEERDERSHLDHAPPQKVLDAMRADSMDVIEVSLSKL